jgi:hypothetical protein
VHGVEGDCGASGLLIKRSGVDTRACATSAAESRSDKQRK